MVQRDYSIINVTLQIIKKSIVILFFVQKMVYTGDKIKNYCPGGGG
jgi:hypothetical protein